MVRTLRIVSLSILLAAAAAAFAQTPAQMSSGGGGNPAARGGNTSFFFGGLKTTTTAPSASSNALSRPTAQFGPVTPVPEPSEWALLMVGLTFVGWIVRRKTRQ